MQRYIWVDAGTTVPEKRRYCYLVQLTRSISEVRYKKVVS